MLYQVPTYFQIPKTDKICAKVLVLRTLRFDLDLDLFSINVFVTHILQTNLVMVLGHSGYVPGVGQYGDAD